MEASGNRLPVCVIDYTEEWVTSNRLPGMCNRLHSAFFRFSCPEAVWFLRFEVIDLIASTVKLGSLSFM